MLRSADTMRGYTLQANDGEIGTVYAFLFDDEQTMNSGRSAPIRIMEVYSWKNQQRDRQKPCL